MDALQLQHDLQAELRKQIDIACQAAALLTPDVVRQAAEIAEDLEGSVRVHALGMGLDVDVYAASDLHPDALLIALRQHLPVIERIDCWLRDDVHGCRHVCVAGVGALRFSCISYCTVAAGEVV